MTPPTRFPLSSSTQVERRVSNPKFVGTAYRTHSWPCPRPSAFAILVMYKRDDVHLQLTGEFGSDAIDALDNCVATALEERPRQLVLDLSALGSIDRCGVDYLSHLLERSDALGVHLVLDSPGLAVLEAIMDVAGSEPFSIR